MTMKKTTLERYFEKCVNDGSNNYEFLKHYVWDHFYEENEGGKLTANDLEDLTIKFLWDVPYIHDEPMNLEKEMDRDQKWWDRVNFEESLKDFDYETLKKFCRFKIGDFVMEENNNKKKGRPKGLDNRTKYINLRVTDAEHATIKRNAEENRLSISSFVLKRCIDEYKNDGNR